MFQLMTLAALTLCPAAPVPEVMPLQWKLKKGDVFYVKSNLVYQIIYKEKDNEVHDSNCQIFSKYTVIDLNANGYVIEQYIEKFESDELRIKPDLEKRGSEILNEIKIKFRTNLRFEVISIQVAYKLEHFGKEKQALANQMYEYLEKDWLAGSFSHVFEHGPDKVVKVGDNWTRKFKKPLSTTDVLCIERDCNYLNSNVIDRVNYIDTGIYQAKDGTPHPIGDDVLSFKSCKGEYSFDSTLGRLKSRSETTRYASIGLDIIINLEINTGDKSLVKDK